MNQMLSSPKLAYWPIVSIAGLALRKEDLVTSLFWYKYARLVNLMHKTVKKDKKRKGLVASRPNEYCMWITSVTSSRKDKEYLLPL